jgi:hypothetical protein
LLFKAFVPEMARFVHIHSTKLWKTNIFHSKLEWIGPIDPHIATLSEEPNLASLAEIVDGKFTIFVEFFLTFPFGMDKIICGMVYTAAVWAVACFMITGKCRGFRDRSVRDVPLPRALWR